MAISKQESFELYKKMYFIRSAERAIQEFYGENEMKTPMHMSMGEEAIVAGVVQALNKEDQVFGTYRNHALYLAKSGDLDNFFAELYGKDTALMKGKAGSMHLSSPKDGLMGTSAIVATTIPVAVGCALANVYMGNKRKVAVFFGDGATDEGSFWESLNFACLKKLPIIFVYEDNDLAIHSFKKERKGYDCTFGFNNISGIINNYNCYTSQDSSATDCESIYNAVKILMDLQDDIVRPIFLNLSYYRYLEHVGIDTDYQFGYRKDISSCYKDPVDLQRHRLLKLGIKLDEIKEAEDFILLRIEKAIRRAKNALPPKKEELFTNVYA